MEKQSVDFRERGCLMAFILLVYFAKRTRLALMHRALYPRQLDVACRQQVREAPEHRWTV